MKRRFVCGKCNHYLGEYDPMWFKAATQSPLANHQMFCRLCGSKEFYIDDFSSEKNEGANDFTINDTILEVGNDGLSHIHTKNEEE